MSGNFDVTVVKRNGRATVCVSGEVDLTVREQLLEALAGAEESGDHVWVDLGDVTFIDSSGIHALVRGHLDTPDASMRIVCVSDAVRRVFELSGLAEFLPVTDAAWPNPTEDFT
jgi:anti-anti-sigma factor